MDKVTEEIYRGKRPDITDLVKYKKLGIKSIITLEKDAIFILEEKNQCRGLGLICLDFPMSELKAPSFDTLLAANILLKVVAKPVFVHCKHGCDRTGYMIAAYRMLEGGWSFKDAWRECVKHGHKWYLLPWWIPSLWRVKKCILKTGKR